MTGNIDSSGYYNNDNTSAALLIKGLNKTYYSNKKGVHLQAIKNLNLSITPGKIVGLLGKNGAGKSTCINIISGTRIKDSGTIQLFDYDLDESPIEFRKSIGIVPQELTVDPLFTPYESLELQAGLYGVRRKERKTKDLLKALGLTEKMHVLSSQLSGGMKRRVMVAKALVHNPPIVILDEPTAGVDISLRKSMWDYLIELNKSKGTTILLTTHYLEEAESLCDEIAIVDKGELICHLPQEELSNIYNENCLIVELEKSSNNTNLKIDNVKIIHQSPKLISLFYPKHLIRINEILTCLTQQGVSIKSITNKNESLEEKFNMILSNDNR